MTDFRFPIINYKGNSFENGLSHGEQFKDGIKELYEIRRDLLIKRNPSLKNSLNTLAKEQYEITRVSLPDISEEIRGIAQGSSMSVEGITLLNNYTDFRDIELADEGCSTFYTKGLAGQTWDMHGSAKDYLCLIQTEGALILSILGCVGMAGLNSRGVFVGVNNLNTKNAASGLIWPALVRHLLEQVSFNDAKEELEKAKVTSGHNYLLADKAQGEMLEVLPNLICSTGYLNGKGQIYHTNHCLDEKTKALEDSKFVSKTTHARLEILEKKANSIHQFSDLVSLLCDHEGEPNSICSHLKIPGSSDPSQTCGGFATDFTNISLWRGCKKYDDNFVQYDFTFSESTFLRIN